MIAEDLRLWTVAKDLMEKRSFVNSKNLSHNPEEKAAGDEPVARIR